jgi:hypothetical protein
MSNHPFNMKEYHSDRPITTSEEDLFGRSEFAEQVVSIVSGLNNNENYVIGIFAEWGFGKTSTVNIIRNIFGANKDVNSVYIDAWALSAGVEGMVWGILSQMYSGVTAKAKPFDWLRSLADDPKDPSARMSSFNARDIGNICSSMISINKAKSDLEDKISRSTKKIVVFIDNVDRLEGREIIEVFRAINSVANYAGVTYILPFDKKYVSAAVQGLLPEGQSGARYIERFIQIPLPLPAILQTTADRVFVNEVEQLLAELSAEVTIKEARRFGTIYYRSGLNRYVRSPRDVNKIINALRFSLPNILGEANIVDMVCIDIIRMFDEAFYSKIKDNKDLLIKTYRSVTGEYHNDDNDTKRKAAVERIFKQDDGFQFAVISKLFPLVDSIFRDVAIQSDTDEEVRKLQRIASDKHYDVFFTSIVGAHGVSDQRILSIINSGGNKEDLVKWFETINVKNYDTAITLIADYSVNIENRLEFCEVLLDLAERLPKRPKSALSLSAKEKILYAVDKILLLSETRLADYKSLLQYSHELGRIDMVSRLIRLVVHHDFEIKVQNEVFLSADELKEFKELALSIIKKIADSNQMPMNSHQPAVDLYYHWAHLGEKQDIDAFIKNHVKTAEGAIDFTAQFLGVWSNMGGSYDHWGELNSDTFDTISMLVEPKYFYDLIVNDSKYKSSVGITEDKLVSFRKSLEEGKAQLSMIGNECTDEFRVVIAQRFIYLYNKSLNKNEAGVNSISTA